MLKPATLGLCLALGAVVVRAEAPGAGTSPQAAAPEADAVDPSLSPECRVPGSKLYTLARLAIVKEALKEKRPIRVLSVGTTAAGLGPSASYPVRLENALKRSWPDVEVEVESRGLPGEVASGAGERLRTIVAEVEPDLVVWQVGTNDALARVDADSFGEALRETIGWVKSHDMDIVLIDPLFTQSLADDESYNDLVERVREVATQERVPLVRRYEAMRFLSAVGDRDGEVNVFGRHFRLNDLGLRCMAEHVARAITLSLLQPDAASSATGGQTKAPEAGKPAASAPSGAQ